MRLVLLLAVQGLIAAPALAAEAPTSAAPAAEPPICTTTTTVVKRGDVVLSTNSTTKCEEEGPSGGGMHPSALLQAPVAVFNAPAHALEALGGGNGDRLTLRNTAGDWQAVDGRTGGVCHLTLSVRAAPAGFVARGGQCPGPLRRAAAWTYRDGGAEVLQADGQLIVRLTGDRDHLTGSTADGDALTLQR